jgi:hypothetical protein
MLGAIWFVFLQTPPSPNSYFSYERQLARCHTKSTSQARYDCASQLMLAKDNAIFEKTLVVLVPPLWLFGAFVVVDRIVRRRQEEKKNRAAIAASHERMAEWHEFLRRIKSGAESEAKSGAATARALKAPIGRPGHPIGTPSPLAKKR